MFCSAMSAEILRIWKAKNKFPEFIKSANILIGRIKKKGGLMNQCVFYSDF